MNTLLACSVLSITLWGSIGKEVSREISFPATSVAYADGSVWSNGILHHVGATHFEISQIIAAAGCDDLTLTLWTTPTILAASHEMTVPIIGLQYEEGVVWHDGIRYGVTATRAEMEQTIADKTANTGGGEPEDPCEVGGILLEILAAQGIEVDCSE